MLSADLVLFAAEIGAEMVVPGCELLFDFMALSLEKEAFLAAILLFHVLMI